MPFKKGASGNPNGRPVKSRALTAILEAAGNEKIEYNGKKIARKDLLAQLVWQLSTTGEAKMPNGETLKLDAQDVFAIMKFLFQHIDGPPKTELDVTSNGESIIPILKTGMDLDEL